VDPSNWEWKNICVFGIKRTYRRDRNWFALHSSNLSWVPYYISPRWIDISLLTITSKRLNGCETVLRCQSCRFIVKWIALLNSWLSCKVDSCRVWLKFEWMSKPNLSDLCRQATKALFLFPTTYCCEAVFQTIFLKQGTDTNFNQKTTSGVRWRPQALISTNLWNKLRDKILIEICGCGRWTEFAKTSVCIILVVLVYLESAKIYTGPKILRVLKRLRNTALSNGFVNSNIIKKLANLFISQE